MGFTFVQLIKHTKMHLLIITQFCAQVDAATQRFNPASACNNILQPYAFNSFEEACQELQSFFMVIAGERGCMALVSELDFHAKRHQRFEIEKSSIELMPLGEERLRLTLNVCQRAPWNEKVDVHFTYTLEVAKQK